MTSSAWQKWRRSMQLRMLPDRRRKKKGRSTNAPLIAALLTSLLCAYSGYAPGYAATPTATPSNSDDERSDETSNLEPDREKYKIDYQDIEAVLNDIERNWNDHNL